jgi:hypothetical protein
MRAVLAALALLTSPAASAPTDAGMGDAATEPVSARQVELQDAGANAEDEAVIRDLEMLEHLDVLKRLDVFDPGEK